MHWKKRVYAQIKVKNVPCGELSRLRGYSSVGRATGSQSVGRRFDPDYLHHFRKTEDSYLRFFVF